MIFLKDPSARKAPPDVIKRLERFARLNAEAGEWNAWITSTPGNREVIVECLPGSA
jgi:hypothetical protein